MMLYLIHPYHRDDRGCWRMSGTVIELACFPDVERPDSHRRVSSRISTADWTAWGFKERTSLSFWVILDHLGPFWAILGHLGPYLGHIGPFGVIFYQCINFVPKPTTNFPNQENNQRQNFNLEHQRVGWTSSCTVYCMEDRFNRL